MPHGRPAKRRKLTPDADVQTPSQTIEASDLFHRAADWDLEQNYERRARNKKTTESNKLPIKNLDGKVVRTEKTETPQDDSDSFLGSGSEDDETPPTEDVDNDDAAPVLPLKQQLIQAQEEIARLAGLINEDPEEHAACFKKLAALADSKSHPSIQKLLFLSQAAIYKDAVPGYRIRAYQDEDMGNKVSKDVRRTRQYEHSLVTSYHAYVRRLVDICKHNTADEHQLKSTALNCVSTLLLNIPHFNFRTELLDILVHELSSKTASTHFTKSIEVLHTFLDNDDDGAPSLEAVTLLSKMIKARDFDIQEAVLDVFFHLRLLTELSRKGSTTKTDKAEDLSKLHGRRAKKEKWEHRSKNEKKTARERKKVEKEMREADAAVDFEAREKKQSETLKIVFITYFRILKAQIPHLMGAVLEGLAKFAHLINQDFFGDILEALKDIISQAASVSDDEEEQDDEASHVRDRLREGLLSTQTAFTLLSQQDAAKSASALHLDLSFFTSHVFRSLYQASIDADVELGPKSLHLPDPSALQTSKRENKVNVSTPVLLLTRALTAILLTPSQTPTTSTLASFYKRLLACVLQTPEKSTLAILALMDKIVDKHGRKLEPLWYTDERKGDGLFRPEAETVEGSNVFAVGSGVWENELLKHHFCPEVRESVKSIDKAISILNK